MDTSNATETMNMETSSRRRKVAINAGVRLKELRLNLGFSQALMAEKAGCKESYIFFCERGKYDPTAHFLIMLCEKFNANPRWLVDGRRDQPMFIEPKKVVAKIAKISKPLLHVSVSAPNVNLRLKKLRKKLGLTKDGMAQVIGFGRISIYKWEKGITVTSDTHLTSICDKLDVNPKWLIEGKEDQPMFIGLNGIMLAKKVKIAKIAKKVSEEAMGTEESSDPNESEKQNNQALNNNLVIMKTTKTMKMKQKANTKKTVRDTAPDRDSNKFAIGVGGRMKKLRQTLALTGTKIANLCSCNSSYIYNTERGIIKPSLKFVTRVCDLLGANPEWLISGQEDKPMFIGVKGIKLVEEAKKRMEEETVAPNANLRLKKIVQKLDLPITKFASKCSVSSSYIYECIKNNFKPSIKLLNKICDVFQVNPRWLINGEKREQMFMQSDVKNVAKTSEISEGIDNEVKKPVSDKTNAEPETKLKSDSNPQPNPVQSTAMTASPAMEPTPSPENPGSPLTQKDDKPALDPLNDAVSESIKSLTNVLNTVAQAAIVTLTTTLTSALSNAISGAVASALSETLSKKNTENTENTEKKKTSDH